MNILIRRGSLGVSGRILTARSLITHSFGSGLIKFFIAFPKTGSKNSLSLSLLHLRLAPRVRGLNGCVLGFYTHNSNSFLLSGV